MHEFSKIFPFSSPTTATQAALTLDCSVDKLKNLCPVDNEQRMCTCVLTSGNALRWETTRPGVFTSPGVSFFTADPVGTMVTSTSYGFIAILNNTAGHLASSLIFTPTAVSTTSLTVSCENPYNPTTSGIAILAITYAGMTVYYLY